MYLLPHLVPTKLYEVAIIIFSRNPKPFWPQVKTSNPGPDDPHSCAITHAGPNACKPEDTDVKERVLSEQQRQKGDEVLRPALRWLPYWILYVRMCFWTVNLTPFPSLPCLLPGSTEPHVSVSSLSWGTDSLRLIASFSVVLCAKKHILKTCYYGWKLHFNRISVRHRFALLNLNQTCNISKTPFIAKALILQMSHAGKDYLID